MLHGEYYCAFTEGEAFQPHVDGGALYQAPLP